MTDFFYPCAYSDWGEAEHSAMARVMISGRFTQGAEVEQCELEFAAYFNRKHAIFCNSGSSANLLAVMALFLKQDAPLSRGDKVVVPAIAWGTTYSPLMQMGLDLVVQDVDATWDVPQQTAIDKDIRLVVGCSVLGNPCNFNRMFARPPECYFLNDDCESIGAWIGPLGSKKYTSEFGDLTTESFYFSHAISAIEGGMIFCESDELAGICRSLRDHGMTRWTKPETFEDEYRFVYAGTNTRGLELHAAIAREQLKKLEAASKQRQQNFNNFVTVVMARKFPIEMQARYTTSVMSPFGISFTCENTEARAKLVKALRANSIDCRLPTGGSFRKHPVSAKWADQQTPNADRVHDCGLFLGNAGHALDAEIDRALRVIKDTLGCAY